MRNATNETAIRNALAGKSRAQQCAILNAKAKAVIEHAIGRPCLGVTIGVVILTEWETSNDAAAAAGFFASEMGKATRVSLDSDLGWICEAAERF
jgi:hypothetical protein